MVEEAREVVLWVQEVTGVSFCKPPGEIEGEDDFAELLKDGIQLCLLAETLGMGTINYSKKAKMPFLMVRHSN